MDWFLWLWVPLPDNLGFLIPNSTCCQLRLKWSPCWFKAWVLEYSRTWKQKVCISWGTEARYYFVLETNFLPSGSFPSSYTFPPGSDAAKVDGTPCILPPPPAEWSHETGWGPRREVDLGQAGPSFCALISAESNPTSWPLPKQNCICWRNHPPYVWVILSVKGTWVIPILLKCAFYCCPH